MLQALYLYFSLLQKHRRCARDLQRLDSTTRSPVFAFIGESIASLPSVRAFGYEAFFTATNRRQVCVCVERNEAA